MKRITWLILILAFKIFAALPAQGIIVEKHILPENGLTVLLNESRRVPRCTVYLWYKVGSRDEEPGKTGSAHFFEHFMYKGNKFVKPDEQDDAVMRCRGTLNASTGIDRTDYYQTVSCECLEGMLRFEAARMRFLKEGMTQENFDSERRIVLAELEERGSAPYGQAFKTLLKQAYPQGHPYQWTPIGSIEDLKAWTLDDARKFFSTYYVPNNAVLSISGDIDSRKTLEMARKWFGTIKPGPTPPPAKVTPNTDGVAVLRGEIEDPNIQIPLVMLAYRIPGKGQPGWMEISILTKMLAEDQSSPLVQNLQYQRRLVMSVDSDVMDFQLGDLLLVSAKPAPGKSPKEVEAAIREQIKRILEKGPDPGELDGLKKILQTESLLALQGTLAIARSLAENEAVYRDPNYLEKQIEKIDTIDQENMLKIARQYLRDENSTVLFILPKGQGGSQ